MTAREGIYDSLESFAIENGASLFGAADISEMKKEFPLLPENSPGRAVSIAVQLSRAVLNTVKDEPTRLYFHHYRQVNYFLDNLALKIANRLQQAGYEAMPVPASQVIDRERQRGHLSHIRVARAAGLGHIGRNNLLVTPAFGAGVRLATVLTDMPLERDKTGGGRDCGGCRECVSLCPAGAIKEKPELFDREACFRQLDDFRKKTQIGHHICGICVRACRGGGDSPD